MIRKMLFPKCPGQKVRHYFTPGLLIVFSAFNKNKLYIPLIIVTLFFQLLNKIDSVINRIYQAIFIAICDLIIGATFEPKF